MPPSPQPCSTVPGSGEQCWPSVCVCVSVCVCSRVQAAARGLDPGSPAVHESPLSPDPLPVPSRLGKRCQGQSSARQGWGGGFAGPGSPLPTSRKPLTVMAKPFVRGSRWCLRLGSPLAWATCMLTWCFFSVNRVPSQWIRNCRGQGGSHTALRSHGVPATCCPHTTWYFLGFV